MKFVVTTGRLDLERSRQTHDMGYHGDVQVQEIKIQCTLGQIQTKNFHFHFNTATVFNFMCSVELIAKGNCVTVKASA